MPECEGDLPGEEAIERRRAALRKLAQFGTLIGPGMVTLLTPDPARAGTGSDPGDVL